MATKVSVSLSDQLYRRAQQYARKHQQEVEEAISTLLEKGLAAQEADAEVEDWSDHDPAVDREREAYLALHPQLKKQYLGKYVAIYQGQLIDHDTDAAALAARVKAQHPGDFVLVTQVRQEAIRTVNIRSPRIIRDKIS